MLRALVLACVLACSAALRLPAVLRQSESALSRRSFGAQAASGLAALALGSTAANAEEPSRMGGILEPYVDAPRGFKLLKPSGWNKVPPPPPPPPPHRHFRSLHSEALQRRPAATQRVDRRPDKGGYRILRTYAYLSPATQFDVDPGVYDVKFQDLIEPFETVQVSTSPVATATSVDALGEVAAVGEKFAKGREAEVVKSKKRNVGDVLVYEFELKGPVYHELLLLSINKGKLYRLSCISRNPRWDKRKELYKNIALSFVPQGF